MSESDPNQPGPGEAISPDTQNEGEERVTPEPPAHDDDHKDGRSRLEVDREGENPDPTADLTGIEPKEDSDPELDPAHN